MNRNRVFGNVNEALPVLMDELLADGEEFGSRGGRTLELTHIGITLTRPWQREIVLPERKASIAAQIAETMWVLAGRTDVDWLSHYLPRALDFSDDGATWRAGYGQRLRNYQGVDQLAYIVDTLRASPGSRQAVAVLWDPTVDTTPGKDIACNNWLNFSSRLGHLDLHVGIRSNDAMWGWSGINAFEWSALQEIVAGMLGLRVGALHFSVTSFHLYDIHWEKAKRIAVQEGNFMFNDSPRFASVDDLDSFDSLTAEWFNLEGQIRKGASYFNQRNVDEFPEPMLRSWLRVLQWWWTGDHNYLAELRNTRLYEAAKSSIQPRAGARAKVHEPPSFLDHVNALHAEKHAAYGDSWKRRGEYMILANIARKIDRLGNGADTTDETQVDTAIDLLVYLAKYRCWLVGSPGDPADLERMLPEFNNIQIDANNTYLESTLIDGFAILEQTPDKDKKVMLVDNMLERAFVLARSRWL